MDKYITKNAQNTIPVNLQIYIWTLWEKFKQESEKSKKEFDYLQVFELKTYGDLLIIEHQSEVPRYKKEYQLIFPESINEKIFIIQENDYATFMLADDY